MNLVESIEKSLKKNDKIPAMRSGDTVRVHQKIVEGDKERIQVFQGTVIRMRRGGMSSNFTVRRIASNNVGVERTYLIYSPRIDKVEVIRHAKVRRAQLYYFRELQGKSARLKEDRSEQQKASAAKAAAKAATAAAAAASKAEPPASA